MERLLCPLECLTVSVCSVLDRDQSRSLPAEEAVAVEKRWVE